MGRLTPLQNLARKGIPIRHGTTRFTLDTLMPAGYWHLMWNKSVSDAGIVEMAGVIENIVRTIANVTLRVAVTTAKSIQDVIEKKFQHWPTPPAEGPPYPGSEHALSKSVSIIGRQAGSKWPSITKRNLRSSIREVIGGMGEQAVTLAALGPITPITEPGTGRIFRGAKAANVDSATSALAKIAKTDIKGFTVAVGGINAPQAAILEFGGPIKYNFRKAFGRTIVSRHTKSTSFGMLEIYSPKRVVKRYRRPVRGIGTHRPIIPIRQLDGSVNFRYPSGGMLHRRPFGYTKEGVSIARRTISNQIGRLYREAPHGIVIPGITEESMVKGSMVRTVTQPSRSLGGLKGVSIGPAPKPGFKMRRGGYKEVANGMISMPVKITRG